MKKLNRKGFTLIELLAVIVIMAIIVVVTVPTIINTIADARVNSIWNLAKATANSYETIVAQDLIKDATNKVIEGKISIDDSWKCVGDSSERGGLGVDLVSILDLPVDDLNLGGSYEKTVGIITSNWNGSSPDTIENYITENTCSAIRLKNGKVEILLVARDKGKFDVSGQVVYALSTAEKGIKKSE